MIIELVGLPGSGKSTFAKKLVQESGWQIVRTQGVIDILWNNLCFALRHPVFFGRGLMGIFRFRGARELWYTKFINLFLVHNAKYMKASRLPRAIIDQGHHQNVISLFDKPESIESIRSYILTLPPPDVLLVFVAEKGVRAERLRSRGYGAREDLSRELKETWESAREKNFELLYSLRGELFCTTMVATPQNEVELTQKLRGLRLWRFVMHLRMPTEKAHGLQIANTLQALAREGESVELWVTKRKNPITEDVFKYYGLDERFPVRYLPVIPAIRLTSLLGAVAYWLEAVLFLATLCVKRLDTTAIYYTRNAEVAWLFARRGATVIFEAHSWPASHTAVFRYFLGDVKKIVANSEGTAHAYESVGFTNVEVVRNGVDLERFRSAPSKEDARRELLLPMEKQIVMYVGSFARWKGVATLYGAWKKIREEFPNAILVMVGGTKEQLLQFPECAGVQNDESVIVKAHEPSELIPAYLSAADVLVLPNEPVSEESIRYTSPIKLFEYMASGRPIVASDLPSIREILSEEIAVFVQPDNKEDLARGIAIALKDSVLGEKLASKAREKVAQWTWQKRAENLRKIISQK